MLNAVLIPLHRAALDAGVSGRLAEIEHTEMPPLVAAPFARMCVEIEGVNTDDTGTDRQRDRAEHAAHRIRIARRLRWRSH